jgi:Fe-S oxidoreductase
MEGKDMKVSLFVTCLVDMFQSGAGKATVELLERLGCEIDFPESQVCRLTIAAMSKNQKKR